MDEGVTDAVRRKLGVPALAVIRERQAETNREIERRLEQQQAPRTPTTISTSLRRGSMTGTELRSERERLGWSTEKMASELDVSEAEVRGWEAGDIEISRQNAETIRFHVAVADQDAALVAAGHPSCDWVVAWEAEMDAEALGLQDDQLDRLDKHVESCGACQARERYAEEHLPPLPSLSMTPSVRVLVWAAGMVSRLPAWARPAAVGAGATLAITAVRMLFALPRLFRDPGQAGPMLLALAAAAGAGAAGGLVYSAVRPIFRRMGPTGNYLTGVVCVLAYMASLALVAPVAFGEPIVEDPAGWWMLVVLGVFFGLMVGHGSLQSPKRAVPTP